MLLVAVDNRRIWLVQKRNDIRIFSTIALRRSPNYDICLHFVVIGAAIDDLVQIMLSLINVWESDAFRAALHIADLATRIYYHRGNSDVRGPLELC